MDVTILIDKGWIWPLIYCLNLKPYRLKITNLVLQTT